MHNAWVYLHSAIYWYFSICRGMPQCPVTANGHLSFQTAYFFFFFLVLWQTDKTTEVSNILNHDTADNSSEQLLETLVLMLAQNPNVISICLFAPIVWHVFSPTQTVSLTIFHNPTKSLVMSGLIPSIFWSQEFKKPCTNLCAI